MVIELSDSTLVIMTCRLASQPNIENFGLWLFVDFVGRSPEATLQN